MTGRYLPTRRGRSYDWEITALRYPRVRSAYVLCILVKACLLRDGRVETLFRHLRSRREGRGILVVGWDFLGWRMERDGGRWVGTPRREGEGWMARIELSGRERLLCDFGLAGCRVVTREDGASLGCGCGGGGEGERDCFLVSELHTKRLAPSTIPCLRAYSDFFAHVTF